MNKYFYQLVILLSVIGLLPACKKNRDGVVQNCTYVPTYVDTTINLTDNDMVTLKTKGYVYIKGGYRGIVIHKNSDTEYHAFERASTYEMAKVGCQLKVDKSLFFLKDTCSGSKFDLSGNILEGPASCPLQEYATSFIGSDRLRIYHSQQ